MLTHETDTQDIAESSAPNREIMPLAADWQQ